MQNVHTRPTSFVFTTRSDYRTNALIKLWNIVGSINFFVDTFKVDLPCIVSCSPTCCKIALVCIAGQRWYDRGLACGDER